MHTTVNFARLVRLFVFAAMAGAYSAAAAQVSEPALGPEGTTSVWENVGASATSTFLGQYRVDNGNGRVGDDNYGAAIDRLNLLTSADEYSAALRVDGFLFYRAPADDHRNALVLERAALQYDGGRIHLTGGDFYRELGRGIVLSVRKGDELGVDLAIRGGLARFASDAFEVAVFAGITNPANLDSVSYNYVRDANDLLAGAESEVRPLDGVTLKAFGIYSQPQERIFDQQVSGVSGGIAAELTDISDWLVIYAEADAQRRQVGASGDTGFAGYLTADSRIGDTTLLLEGLYLNAFEQFGGTNSALNTRFSYNRPPTLLRIQDEVTSNRDVVGSRARLEHYLPDAGLLLHVTGAVRLDDFFDPTISYIRELHGYGGFEWEFSEGRSRLSASAGLRHDSRDGEVIKRMTHVDFDYLHAFKVGFAVHLTSTNELRQLGAFDYARGTSVLGIQKSGLGELAFEFGFDTQDRAAAGTRQRFYAGHVGAELSSMFQLKAVAGTQRGGLTCLAGLCRDLPEFAGARLELVARI